MRRTQVHIDAPGYLAWKRQRDERDRSRSILDQDQYDERPRFALRLRGPIITNDMLIGVLVLLAFLLAITLLGGW